MPQNIKPSFWENSMMVSVANLTESRITRKMGLWYVWSIMLSPWRWKEKDLPVHCGWHRFLG